MKKSDLILSLILLALALVTLVETSKLPIGNLSSPHVGFFPLIIGIVLAILSSLLLISAIGKRGIKEKLWVNPGGWKPLGLTVGSLFLFAIFFERVGYLVCSFLFVAFLMAMPGTKKWWVILIYAFSSTFAFYLLFDLFLNTQLPSSILGR